MAIYLCNKVLKIFILIIEYIFKKIFLLKTLSSLLINTSIEKIYHFFKKEDSSVKQLVTKKLKQLTILNIMTVSNC